MNRLTLRWPPPVPLTHLQKPHSPLAAYLLGLIQGAVMGVGLFIAAVLLLATG